MKLSFCMGSVVSVVLVVILGRIRFCGLYISCVADYLSNELYCGGSAFTESIVVVDAPTDTFPIAELNVE